MAVVHVKFKGQSRDVDLTELFPESTNDAQVNEFSDVQIQQSISSMLDIPQSEFNGYVVERHQNGNATLHPQAEFGK